LATNVFISYNFKDEETASIISYLLRQQPELDPFLYADERRTDEWPKLLIEKLSICHAFVYLAGKVLGETQEREVNWHFKDGVEAGQKTLVVCLPGCTIPKHFAIQGNFRPLPDPKASLPILDDPIAEIARQIALRLTGHWVPSDGVPLGYLFDYEKEIIKAYKNKRLSAENGLAPKLLESGCPPNWPEIVRRDADRELHESFQSTIGAFRDPSDGIAVDTRTAYGTGPGDHTATNPLTFPEAGPRQCARHQCRNRRDCETPRTVSQRRYQGRVIPPERRFGLLSERVHADNTGLPGGPSKPVECRRTRTIHPDQGGSQQTG
jgi:hypothetical protein